MRQELVIARHLYEAGSLTSKDALAVYGIQDLPKRISVLRQEGWPISRRLRTGADGKRFATYFFKGDMAEVERRLRLRLTPYRHGRF